VKPEAVLKAEQRLRDSEERIRGIVNTAVEGIITIDERGIIETFNPAAERIFGHRAEEVVGRNVSLLMPSPDREAHDGYIANYLRTGKAKIIGIGREVVGLRKDGTTFPMDLSIGEVRLASGRMFTGIVRDITERKRLEKEILEISDREQRRIGQDLHDDLCQHLAGIELMSELLQEKLAAKSQPESAQAARIAERVQRAIEQTRRLARGLSPLELEDLGLRAVLTELAANTTELFGIRCECEAPDPISIDDPAAAMHLYRIAQEAINNALKHGHAHTITIRLAAEDEQITLSIHDDGAGFSPPNFDEHGMGLRIMKYRAGMIGGSLAVRPGPGGGGTVVACTFRQRSRNPE
jgi:two-component system sensor kinase FixL